MIARVDFVRDAVDADPEHGRRRARGCPTASTDTLRIRPLTSISNVTAARPGLAACATGSRRSRRGGGRAMGPDPRRRPRRPRRASCSSASVGRDERLASAIGEHAIEIRRVESALDELRLVDQPLEERHRGLHADDAVLVEHAPQPRDRLSRESRPTR